METLEINNFLTIRQAKVDIRRFTILIGPQANGKSIVAKILYYFRNFLTNQYVLSIESQETKRQLNLQAIANFEQIFPKYTWSDQVFNLIYRTKDIELRLSAYETSTKKVNIEFNMSDNLAELHRKAKKIFKRKSEEAKKEEDKERISRHEAYMDVIDCIYSSPINRNFQRSVFIPASRSFFANLQKTVFSFLANNIPIDPLIKQFGSAYESSKQEYNRRRIVTRKNEKEISSLRDEIKQELEKILVGQYTYENGEDWIISGKRKINLANASSGQQEALPMLIVLLTWINRSNKNSRPTTFFIEEPEAHLFPVSQRRLVGIFSNIYDAFNYSFLLTTHSPYILTALNNLIMASNLIEEKGEDSLKQVQKIIGQDKPIRFEDVSAYTIKDGVLKNIIDKDTNLIGSSVIDSVSDEFDKVFDKLLELKLT